MKLEGRRSSRLHLEFDPVTTMCLCGCGLSMRESHLREAAIAGHRVKYVQFSASEKEALARLAKRSSFSGKLAKMECSDDGG